MAAPRYSLIIPTYNRPEELGRLLRCLAWQKADFPVLVLDSSRPAEHERNLAAARGAALDLRLERFDPALPPWEKFHRGAQMVGTEFSSLCADDDLVLVSSIGPLVEFLSRNPGYGVAHGWYFQFYLAGMLGLAKIVYRSPSIADAEPIERLNRLFANYEALTYGVHRTALLREIMVRVQGVQTMLGRELLGGALAVVAGKVARLPMLYAGRNMGPSAPYTDWNPFGFLSHSPQRLFEEYRRYRDILVEYWAAQELGEAPVDMIDVVHLRYLSEYFQPAVLDHVYRQRRLDRPPQEILDGIPPVLVEKRGLEGALHRSRFLRRMRERFLPWLRGYHVRRFIQPNQQRIVSGALASGGVRSYRVHREFEAALAEGGLGERAEDLIGVLGGYA